MDSQLINLVTSRARVDELLKLDDVIDLVSQHICSSRRQTCHFLQMVHVRTSESRLSLQPCSARSASCQPCQLHWAGGCVPQLHPANLLICIFAMLHAQHRACIWLTSGLCLSPRTLETLHARHLVQQLLMQKLCD